MSTYGWRQITAPLIVCVQCGKAWYMTHPQPVCIECREKKVMPGVADEPSP